ncbi:MAG: CRISPR-associated endoribonuclease Cas6 [Lachnospiraceae bacterium]|nr:CRISPR-associated endoribonuclease Cas6 [Lachnospiraceae bacterium]
MRVYQIRLKLYFLTSIPVGKVQEKLTAFIDKSLGRVDELLQMHEENRFKSYSYDLPYPLEQDKVYKEGKIYTVTIRTVDPKLAKHFREVCVNNYTWEMKGLTAEMRIIPERKIASIYTLTPVILKDYRGYWRENMSLEAFEERLKINLIKKWNALHGEKLQEDFELYTLLEFMNEDPIVMEYKKIRLLGDKIRLQIADNETAQKLAYLALGTGLLEMNSRGAGFVNYRWS